MRRGLVPAAGAAIAALALAGCAGGGGGDSADVDCAAYEEYGTGLDDTVEIYSTIVDIQADRMVESWADFETCTGVTIDFVGTQEAETQINVRVEAGDAPDIMIIPQPGLLNRLIDGGYVVPAPESVEANADEFWSEAWKAYGTGADGTFYAAPLTSSVKGWVWYSPADFEDRGIEIPETLDDMTALTEELAESNDGAYRPWCVGFGSGDATGWVGTDWIEDVVLRTAGEEVYDQWVAGEVDFVDPQITDAFDYVGNILKNEDFVNGGYGGVESIATTTFQDGGLSILDGTCSMHHQASFYETQWPEGTDISEDGDIWAFMTPPAEAGDPAAITGGGELVAAFTDTEATQAVQTFLSSDEWANDIVSRGGVVSANKGLDPANAGSDIGRASIELLQAEDTVFRFDGSDLMPAAVGTNAFWTAMVDWVAGESTETVTQEIDAAFP